MGLIRVVLADDQTVVRRGVRGLLEEAPDIEIVAEAADGHQAFAAVEAQRPDVLLADIEMPGLNGLELANRVSRDFPQTRILILSIHKEREYATKALAIGAGGYLLKDAGAAEFEAAVRAVARGESYLSPCVSGHLVTEYARLAKAEAETADPLTPRQREVLLLIAEGLSTKAIGRQLGISVKTVDAHRGELMERLGIHDIASLVRYAIRAGLIKPGD
jgi:DNA-binding NarL/FixJ family response regulator